MSSLYLNTKTFNPSESQDYQTSVSSSTKNSKEVILREDLGKVDDQSNDKTKKKNSNILWQHDIPQAIGLMVPSYISEGVQSIDQLQIGFTGQLMIKIHEGVDLRPAHMPSGKQDQTLFVRIDVDGKMEEKTKKRTRQGKEIFKWEEQFNLFLKNACHLQVLVFKKRSLKPNAYIGGWSCDLINPSIIKEYKKPPVRNPIEIKPCGKIYISMQMIDLNSPTIDKILGYERLKGDKVLIIAGHAFMISSFIKPSDCSGCEKIIFGENGFRCQICNLSVHTGCHPLVRVFCKTVLMQTGREIIESHDFYYHTYFKPTFCGQCHKILLGIYRQGLRCKSK